MSLNSLIADNSLEQAAVAAATVALVFGAAVIVRRILARQFVRLAEGNDGEWEDFAAGLIKRIHWWVLLLVALAVGSRGLILTEGAELWTRRVAGLVVLLQAGLLGSYTIRFWLKRYRKMKLATDAAGVTTFSAVAFIARVILWTVVAMIALDNVGVDVTALIAGLGVTGIAVALAVQNILGDLFASFSIVLDKPFVIGDFIIVDEHLGTIEHVGLKTTRLRSLSGELLIFSNTDLLKSRIRNFKQMRERRVVFVIGVVYQTPLEKLEAIPGIIRGIVENQRQRPVRFDRSHFKEFGAYALHFETVYWIQDPDYNIYMDIHQAINLAIYRRFADEGIQFAYPSQTLFVRGAAPDPGPAA